jgi:hypothetical protein
MAADLKTPGQGGTVGYAGISDAVRGLWCLADLSLIPENF